MPKVSAEDVYAAFEDEILERFWGMDSDEFQPWQVSDQIVMGRDILRSELEGDLYLNYTLTEA